MRAMTDVKLYRDPSSFVRSRAAAAAPRIARARPARAVRRERDRQKADGTTERTENNHQKTEQTYYIKRRAAEPRPALHPPRFPASFVSQL